MRLYRIGAVWRGTQADAKAEAKRSGLEWVEIDVPTDKPGLLAWLNRGSGSEPVPPTPATEAVIQRLTPHSLEIMRGDTRAERDLAAMDAPGADVERIVETILGSRGYALGRFAKAVAVSFDGLAPSTRKGEGK